MVRKTKKGMQIVERAWEKVMQVKKITLPKGGTLGAFCRGFMFMLVKYIL